MPIIIEPPEPLEPPLAPSLAPVPPAPPAPPSSMPPAPAELNTPVEPPLDEEDPPAPSGLGGSAGATAVGVSLVPPGEGSGSLGPVVPSTSG